MMRDFMMVWGWYQHMRAIGLAPELLVNATLWLRNPRYAAMLLSIDE